MSGTSCDSIDAGLCIVHPDLSCELVQGINYKYPPHIREKIFNLFSGNATVKDVCQMNFAIGKCFANACNILISEHGKPDFIASHGQTIYHYPFDEKLDDISLKSTLQIGESSVIAKETGCHVISNFREADIANGGEGAPLVCFADEKWFKPLKKNIAIQNIGGISNVTVISQEKPTFGFDTGLGNIMIDYCMNKFYGKSKKPYLMYGKFQKFLSDELASIEAAGLYKNERIITSPQRADIKVGSGSDVLNFCANNYLGLSDNKRLIDAAKRAMDSHGYGMSSVRFICGTQDLHKQLEAAISKYFKTEDTILYAACFDANGGLFEPLFTEDDAIISDALNHASIIDGVRLCKAKRYRYANADMAELERCLKEAQAQRFRIIATDGVFSMDGNVAPMDKICDLAEKYDALVMVDESHSAGVVGDTGRGVAEKFNLYGRIDIFTGTLGKAFGGAMGGFTTGRKEIIDMLRQRSRPYLFSNSVAPAIVGASLEMFKMLEESDALHTKLVENVNYFREKMIAAGFDIKPTQSAICAVMLYDAKLSQDFAAKMQEEGIYVTGFYYPVVPKGQARIRVQLSAGHERGHLDKAIAAFVKVGKELGVIK